MTKDKKSDTRKKIEQIYEENELANLEQNRTRARSFTIGCAGGGIIEVGLRGDYSNLWYLLQPVEAIEMMYQLAAASGVEIIMRPRNDFSSWRSWDPSINADTYWVGAAAWQLSQEKRELLQEERNKNIKNIEGAEEKVSEE